MTVLRTSIALGPGRAARSARSELAEFLARVNRAAGLARRPAYRLRLACDELATNVAEHGYAGRPGSVRLTACWCGRWVRLRIEDDAAPFDPTSVRRAPPYARAADVGGAGLVLVRGSVDRFSYEFVDGRNQTTIAVLRETPPAGTRERRGSRG